VSPKGRYNEEHKSRRQTLLDIELQIRQMEQRVRDKRKANDAFLKQLDAGKK
jgi:hypothetical protein